jgi:FkbM family methyltransferase
MVSLNIGPLVTLRFLLRHPLTMHRPLQALSRYVRWQIGSRVVPGAVVVPFVNDARLVVQAGMTGATGNVYAGLHEFEDMSFVLHALRASDLFVDVGANIGSYTVLAAKAVGAHVLAFEPIASTCDALRDNLALNGIAPRVEVWQSCVGSSAGMVRMTSGQDTTNHVLGDGDPRGDANVQVPVVTLDAALAGRRPFMLKIDVEGFELEVVRGASECLAAPTLQCVIMELNACGQRYGRSDAELLARMRDYGFEPYGYEPRTRRLAQPMAAERTGNTIFLRDRSLLEQRLRSAAAYRVLGQNI